MKIERIEISNFRLLRDVKISLEDMTTVVVGRNNSGKTSLVELFRRIFSKKSPNFFLEDFSLSVHGFFWEAFLLRQRGAEENIIREKIPSIQAKIIISYNIEALDLGALSEFIIDLNPDSNIAIASIRYELKEGEIGKLFKEVPYDENADEKEQKNKFFKIMKDRIPKLFGVFLNAIDPTDESNYKKLEITKLYSLIHVGFINAQRGLDDITDKEKDVLGKVLERLLGSASAETATEDDKEVSSELEKIVNNIQQQIDTDFNQQLLKLLPALKLFGYPGLNDSDLHTETTLDVKRLLENHTRLRYTGANGIGLPETYNGLGSRNLIYILLRLFEIYKAYLTEKILPVLCLVFIEEPEVHLHPQMQEVFIRKINEIANIFTSQIKDGQSWPVQFSITTHSTHILNEAPFATIRYFLNVSIPRCEYHYTKIKDLRMAYNEPNMQDHVDFLHKFLTLTRCDLFFADKAILVEGPTERILMPKMIEKSDIETPDSPLSSQYVSLIEVGGAYVHNFYHLLDFLELRALIITDMDSVKQGEGDRNVKCKVTEGTSISNAGIKKWFEDDSIQPQQLLAKSDEDKVIKFRRIAFQVPEGASTLCGRSFEEAFILANRDLFNVKKGAKVADEAWNIAEKIKKTDFALKYAIDETTWEVPKYIKDGLKWLSKNPVAEIGGSSSTDSHNTNQEE